MLQETLRTAKVRRPNTKAAWLFKDFAIVQDLGGPVGAGRAARKLVGKLEKIAFMKQFAGIGDKYSRNIWMDVYDPDFRQTIAIDARIKTVSASLGVTLCTYDEHERFYQGLAEEAGIDGWDLDRLLYNYRDEVLLALKATSS